MNKATVYDANTGELIKPFPNTLDNIVSIIDMARTLLPNAPQRYYPVSTPTYHRQGENFQPTIQQQLYDIFYPRQQYMDYARQPQAKYNPNNIKIIP